MQSQKIVVSEVAQADILDAVAAAMGVINGAKIKLLKEPLTPTPTVTLAACDAAEADYTGYAAITATWQAAAKGVDGVVSADSQAAQFLASGVTTSNTIYGVYVTDSGETTLLGLFALATPIVLGVDLLQALDVQVRVQMSDNRA